MECHLGRTKIQRMEQEQRRQHQKAADQIYMSPFIMLQAEQATIQAILRTLII